jgi:hypothetical protein
MGDAELARAIFAVMIRTRAAGVADYALMYKAALSGIVGVEIVADAPLPQGMGQAQRSALLFMRSFIPPLIAKYAK